MYKISFIVIFLQIFCSCSEDVLLVTLLHGCEIGVCFSDRTICSATYGMLDCVVLGGANPTYFIARRKELGSCFLKFIVCYKSMIRYNETQEKKKPQTLFIFSAYNIVTLYCKKVTNGCKSLFCVFISFIFTLHVSGSRKPIIRGISSCFLYTTVRFMRCLCCSSACACGLVCCGGFTVLVPWWFCRSGSGCACGL